MAKVDRFVRPTKDLVFKKLFSNEKRLHLLQSLIESVLGIELDYIELVTPVSSKDTLAEKNPILDVKAKGANVIYNIELQVGKQTFFKERSLYYWAVNYGVQLGTGQDFQLLQRHICINFLDFTHLDHQKLHSKYVIKEEAIESGVPISNEPLTNHLELHFIQMKELQYTRDDLNLVIEKGSALEKWVFFIKYGDDISIKEAESMSSQIADARKILTQLESDRELIRLLRLKEAEDATLVKEAERRTAQKYEIMFDIYRMGIPDHVFESLKKLSLEALTQLKSDLHGKSDKEEIRVVIKSYIG